MASEVFEAQVALLVRVLPHVATETCFALKGGTAINLFVRDLPRLSVDIDLVYLPIEDRETSLNGIKIEVTPVLRGTVHPTELRTVRPIVEEQFGFAEIQVVSFADLYAGKLVAALDRQHPRDLFDVQYLLANEGIDKTLYPTFLAYILSHNRPAHELLQPRLKDIRQAFEREFVGMTVDGTSLDTLLSTREQLVAEIRSLLDENSKLFLTSFHMLRPDWELTGSSTIRELPAIRWKLMNLERLQIENPEKYQTMLQKLDAALS
jgi:predicted nucleotidyltransferase component of viral defense system